MRTLFPLLIFCVAFDSALGFCGVCGKKSGVTCRDSTSFSFCSDDSHIDPAVYPCPAGTICGDDYRICSPQPHNPCNPTCGNCTSRYACLSENTYALCFGMEYPSGQIYVCQDGTRCSTKKQTDGFNVCFSDLTNEEVDCYKNVIVTIKGTNGGVVLLPPVMVDGIQ